jgi:hypothetical protein
MIASPEAINASAKTGISMPAKAPSPAMSAPVPMITKMERAIRGYYDYTIDAPGAAASLVQCWAMASQKPLIRDLLVWRRERTVTVAALIGREAVDAGELPPDFDIEAMARGFTALLDGLVLQRVEEGDSYRRADMERRALAFLDLVAPRRSDGGAS